MSVDQWYRLICIERYICLSLCGIAKRTFLTYIIVVITFLWFKYANMHFQISRKNKNVVFKIESSCIWLPNTLNVL